MTKRILSDETSPRLPK